MQTQTHGSNFQLILTYILFLLVFGSSFAYGQTDKKPNYNLKFVKAVYSDSINKNDVFVLFALTSKKKKDFPPVFSMKVTYKVNEEEEHVINLQVQQKEALNKISLEIFGSNVQEKNVYIYNLVKDRMILKKDSDLMILVFHFQHISESKVNNMSVTYGLWEKDNLKVRIEEKFDFAIDQ